MPSVPLEVIGQGPYIKAPDCCPYKEVVPNDVLHPGEVVGNGMGITMPYVEHVEGTTNKIHPSICAVCRKCYFVPKAMIVPEGNPGGC